MALMLPQHHEIERVTMQTRISLLNFHTFFSINKCNQEIFALCLSHCDDFDSIICLSLTLIRLNNLIVVGNDIRHCLAFYRKGLKPHRYVALKRAQIIKTSNDMKTMFVFFAVLNRWNAAIFNDIMVNIRNLLKIRGTWHCCRRAWVFICVCVLGYKIFVRI